MGSSNISLRSQSSRNGGHLSIMMFYDFDPAVHDFSNVVSGDGASTKQMVEAHAKWGMRGLPQIPHAIIFDRAKRTLFPQWREQTIQFASTLQPFISNGTFLGVFLGDEIVCGGTHLANLTSVADLLRAQLPAQAILYTNGCSEIRDWPMVPASLDLISLDFYDEHNTNGSAEASKDDQMQ